MTGSGGDITGRLATSLPVAAMTQPRHTTNDPYLASFLLSQGATLLGCQRVGPKTVAFHFEADERLHHLLRVYWNGQVICIVPARLFEALRQLKRRNFVTPRHS